MDSNKMSVQSNAKVGTIQIKTFGNTLNQNTSGQIDIKPKSRFIQPNIIAQPLSQKQSINQLDISLQSKKNEETNLANFMIPEGMTKEEYQQISSINQQTIQFTHYIPIPIKEKEQEETSTADEIIEVHPYQISVYHHPGFRGNFNIIQQIKDSEDRMTRGEVNYQENEIGQFGNVGQNMIYQQKLIYIRDKTQKLSLTQGRQLPVILEVLQQNQENYKRISIKLSEQQIHILQQIKDNSIQFDQVVKELSKYSVTSQVKLILLEKSYQKILDKLIILQYKMNDNLNQINELIQLTETTGEKVPAVSMTNMIDFINKLPQQQHIEFQQLKYATIYICQIMCKQLEIQEEQCINCSQFLIQFNQGLDAVQILYDFIKLKIPKLQNKVSVTNNKFNLIVIPYNEFKQKNDFILQDIQKYLRKMQQKKEFIMQRLMSEIWSQEEIQNLDYNYILNQYSTYRNQIIRNPNKFNYEILKKRPLFILQTIKLLFHAQLQIEELFQQITNLDNIYNLYLEFTKFENLMKIAQLDRLKIQKDMIQTDDQEIFRDQIIQLKKDMDILFSFQNMFPNNVEGLPYGLIQFKNWVDCEIISGLTLLRVLNNKLHSIDILENQVSETEGLQLIEKSIKLIQQIQNLIDSEIPTQYYDSKIKISKDLTMAIQEIQNKYFFDDESKQTPQKTFQQPLITNYTTILEQSAKLLERLSKARESILIKKPIIQEINTQYIQLNEFTFKYQIWEHINATRYLMTSQMFYDIISNIISVEPQKFTLESIIKKIRDHMVYFEMNSQLQTSNYFKIHLRDGLQLYQIFKDNFDEYTQQLKSNSTNPGQGNIDGLITTLQNNINNYFKVKTCTLIQQKEAILKAIPFYINMIKEQFEDSSKAAELDQKFKEAEGIIIDSNSVFQKAEEKLGKIYELGVEAVGQDKTKKNISLEAFRLGLGIDTQLMVLREKAEVAFSQFSGYKEKLSLNSLPEYKNKLEQKYKEFESMLSSVQLLDKTIISIYYSAIDLLESLSDVSQKIENMLSLANSQFILEGLNKQLKQQQDSYEEIKIENSTIQLHPSIQPIISTTNEIQCSLIEMLQGIINITVTFVEIYDGFMLFQDLINLTSDEFFITVYRWLTFYEGKPSDRQLIYNDIIQKVDITIEKLGQYPILRVPCSKTCAILKKVVETYQRDVNVEVMRTLSEFGQTYQTQGNKVQTFQEFQNQLSYLLTPENSKEATRKALTAFYEKNKKAEQPLSRMSQFVKATQSIAKDERLKSQKRLKRVQNIDEIQKEMGAGQMDAWIQACKNMSSALEMYFKNVNENQLQPLINYTQKIEDLTKVMTNQELKKFVSRFLEMLKIDYNLSKFQ